MEIRQLKHFLAIARHGSLGRAAEAEAISEPGLSKSLSKLEAELGVRLFDRGTKGISLTAYGESLMRRADAIIGEVETIRRDVDEVRGGSRGVVRVGVRPSFGTAYLPHALARIMKGRHDMRAILREGFMPTLISELMRGELDFIVVTELEEMDQSLIQEYLTESPVKIMARRDHPLLRHGRPSRDDLAALDWAMPLQTDPIRHHIYDILGRNGIPSVNVIMETNSLLAMKNFVREVGCISFFPVHMYDEQQDRDLTFIDIPELVWHRRLNIVRRRLSSLPPSAEILLTEIKAITSTFRGAAGNPSPHAISGFRKV